MSFWLALATYLIAVTAVLTLFARGDASSKQDVARLTRGWVFERGPAPREAWSRGFLTWFDAVFAVRKVKLPLVGEVMLPSFLRSVLASIVGLILMALVWAIHKEAISRQLRFGDISGGDLRGDTTLLLLVYGSATILTNWIPDYLSLVQSRWVLGRLEGAKHWLACVGWMLLDAIGTLLIAFLAIYVGMVVTLPIVASYLTIHVGCLTPETFTLQEAWTLFVSGLRFESPPGTLNYDFAGVYIYSTFLTSVWVWLYAISGLIVRQAAALSKAKGATTASARPLLVLGSVAAFGFSLVFWGAFAARTPHYDVVIFAPASHRALAEQLSTKFAEEGIDATVAELPKGQASDMYLRYDPKRVAQKPGDTQLAPEEQRFANATLILVLEPVGPDQREEDIAGAAKLDSAFQFAVEAGRRPYDAMLHVYVPTLPAEHSADPSAMADSTEWRMGIGSGYGWGSYARHVEVAGRSPEAWTALQGSLVSWAQRDGSLLAPSQIRVCRERFQRDGYFDSAAFSNAPHP